MQEKAKSFKATLERGGGNLNWTVAGIPFDAAKLWGARGQLRVKGEINGFAFKATLFPTGTGRHMLIVNKKLQAGGKVKLGGTAQFRLQPDTEERVAVVPTELQSALDEDRALRRWFDQLNHSTRRYIGDWIHEVKSGEARLRRTDQIVERILSVMDAERELPPVLRIAFASDPIAHQAWKRLSPSHRRGHLLAIFYYRDPQSRARRIGKMLLEVRQKNRQKSE
jgi:uncharacterized protein YdeI (YjbR/CyaY-like superfamily)